MVRLERRTSISLALSLFGTTATAYAEGAWVLWMHTMIPAVDHDRWKRHPQRGPAIDTREHCEVAAAGAIQASARDLRTQGATATVKGGTVEAVLSNGHKATATAVCLPDTIDPRGPKGK